MDSLTIHYLARELDARWRGRRVIGFTLSNDPLEALIAVDRSPAVCVDLAALHIRVVSDPPDGDLLRGWTVMNVGAPIDDRRLTIRCESAGKFRGSRSRHATTEISFVPTARGAVVRDGGGHTLAAVGAKPPRSAGERPVLSEGELVAAAERGDTVALLRGRWMSPPLARWLAGEPLLAARRYREMCALDSPRPSLCDAQVTAQPWCDAPEVLDSLILPEGRAIPVPSEADRNPRARAIQRMRRELARSADASRARSTADALMALGARSPVPAEVTLGDGSRAAVASEPGDTPVTVAERLYRDARSKDRALTTLPARIAAMETMSRAENPPAPRTAGSASRASPRSPRPYRTYRSSGGLDIWVGRGAKSNDTLTFDVANPDDVWVHARDTAGAHVVLRWQRDDPPPPHDLEEAAALAAWHSRARGSAVVPVDWTRRRHVRRARGGTPGLVTVERARTVFARPSADLERRLRVDR